MIISQIDIFRGMEHPTLWHINVADLLIFNTVIFPCLPPPMMWSSNSPHEQLYNVDFGGALHHHHPQHCCYYPLTNTFKYFWSLFIKFFTYKRLVSLPWWADWSWRHRRCCCCCVSGSLWVKAVSKTDFYQKFSSISSVFSGLWIHKPVLEM